MGMSEMQHTIHFTTLNDVFNPDLDGPRAQFDMLLMDSNFDAFIQFGSGKPVPILSIMTTARIYHVFSLSTEAQTSSGLLDTIAGWIFRGKGPVTVYFQEKMKKAAPISVGQGRSPQSGMKGNLGGYLPTSTAGIGTLVAVGALSYIAYKALVK